MKKLLPVGLLVALFFVLARVRLGTDEGILNGAREFEFEKNTKYLERQKRNAETGEEKQGAARPEFPNEFARFQRMIRTNNGEIAPSYPSNYKLKEWAKAKTARSQRALHKNEAKLPWVERGPNNVGGRTRALLVDPADPTFRTWFAGSVGGGIWKTTDGGQTWANKTPDLPNLATTTLAMAASNSDVLYAGTGEGFYNADAINGDGVFKSVDRGETWEQLAATANDPGFENINRIIVSPENENLVLLCANTGFTRAERLSGIFRSIDGGETWTEVYESGLFPVQQIIANPLNFNTLYAAANSRGVMKSTDAGLTWRSSSSGMNLRLRLELALAPSDTSRIYAAVEVDANVSDLYVSEDGGGTWTLVNDISGSNPNWLNGQGWYDNAIGVHPYEAGLVYVGGVNIFRIGILSSTHKEVTAIEKNNTSEFLTLFDFGGIPGDGVVLGTTIGAQAIGDSDLVSVQLRFGPGVTQRAHRFNPSRGASRPAYPYADYVEVPFQAWDADNHRQLMVSFRDHKNDGAFDLAPYNRNDLGREEIFVHLVPYDSSKTNPNIAAYGGELYKMLYFIWPMLTDSASWDPAALPVSNVHIRVQPFRLLDKRTTTRLTNWFPDQPHPDHPSGIYPFVHADHHNLTMIPLDSAAKSFRILNASDGGVSYSEDGGANWTNMYKGYITSQFYGADKAPGADEYIGGTQDNGTWRSARDGQPGSPWSEDIGGDGFDVSWHYSNPDKIVGSLYFAGIKRTLDHGQSWQTATEGLTDAGNAAPFITPIGKSQSDAELLFTLGASGVWRSDNFAEDWILSPIPRNNWGYNGLSGQVEISRANPRIVWAGFRMSPANNPNVSNIQVATDGGFAFRRTNPYAQVAMGTITGMATHPQEDSTAFLIFSFAHAPKILRTRDLGRTWEDITGFADGASSNNGFPDVATYSVLVMPHQPEEIWAGTEIGLFVSNDDGASWAFADNGLPAASIWEMRVVDDQVVVATHGRGIWSVTIPELRNAPPPEVTLSPVLHRLGQGPDGRLAITISLRSVYDSTEVSITGSPAIKFGPNLAAKDTLFFEPVVQTRTIEIAATAYAEGLAYKSATRRIRVTPLAAPRASYASNFNSGNTDFTGEGFSMSTPAGFNDAAIHTAHPYGNSLNISYQLTVPIIVASTNGYLKYDDIALVEPGPELGSQGFYDYAVVEGSRNGVAWIPLAPGYDARYDIAWEVSYRNGESGRAALFREHRLDLQETFAAGEAILLRFRLFTDASITGWGWAIDNLEIQEMLTAVGERGQTSLTFDLRPNYPNPFNPSTRIDYSLAKPARVNLAIYNSAGRLVRTLVEELQQAAGAYQVQWNGRNNAGETLASGVYLYRLEAGEFVRTRKMVFVK
ncbi:MAG: VPS10 domain-containing protein [bacterium]